MEQARDVRRRDDLCPTAPVILEPVEAHACRDSRLFDREGPAETTAFISAVEGSDLELGDLAEQFPGRVDSGRGSCFRRRAQPQFAQAVAACVEADTMRKRAR